MKTIIFSLILFLSMAFTKAIAQSSPIIGDSLYSFDIGSLTPTPDRAIVGLEYADGYLWATGFDPDDNFQHKLYKLTPEGDSLVEFFSYGIEFAGWSDLAYDGEHLYVADIDTIREIDMNSGQPTGVKIPSPFYYNKGLAYDPATDHFYISGEGGSNIYEIDRNGNIIQAYANIPDHYTLGLAWDTVSPGGPFLWTWSSEDIGNTRKIVADQFSPATGQFTGISFDGAKTTEISMENAGGATIAYDYLQDTLVLIGVHIRNGTQEQMEWAVVYNITSDQLNGAQIAVNPQSIQNTLPPGDSVDIDIAINNFGQADLYWSAYIEGPDPDPANTLGDSLFSFNATFQTPQSNSSLNAVTFLNGHIWVNGRGSWQEPARVYKFTSDGQLIDSHPYYATNSAGFFNLTTDGEYLYAEDTYTIMQIETDSFTVMDYIIKPGISGSGLAYDPQKDHFWIGGGNGAISEINRDGEEVNFYITPYEIEGLAWDRWSAGGPYLWAWVEDGPEQGPDCTAIRLDPNTCTSTGVTFTGIELNDDPELNDEPLSAFVTNAWQEDKVVMLGLQNSTTFLNNDTISGTDHIVAYDLDVIPPPDWIELLDTTYGVVSAGDSSQLTVRLRSIMEDTLTTAAIRISNNDVINPDVYIPVNFTMLPNVFTGNQEWDASTVSAYPNPVSSSTTISFRVENPGNGSLKIYDNKGRLVKNVFEKYLDTGEYSIRRDLSELKPGLYFYRLTTGNQAVSGKLIRN